MLDVEPLRVLSGGDVLDDGVIIPFRPLLTRLKLLTRLLAMAGLHILFACAWLAMADDDDDV